MKRLLVFVSFVLLVTTYCTIITGATMIIIGAMGHIFSIENFKLLSFWEVFILAILFGVGRGLAIK